GGQGEAGAVAIDHRRDVHRAVPDVQGHGQGRQHVAACVADRDDPVAVHQLETAAGELGDGGPVVLAHGGPEIDPGESAPQIGGLRGSRGRRLLAGVRGGGDGGQTDRRRGQEGGQGRRAAAHPVIFLSSRDTPPCRGRRSSYRFTGQKAATFGVSRPLSAPQPRYSPVIRRRRGVRCSGGIGGAGIRCPGGCPAMSGKRAVSWDSQASRAATISSWLRPTKFHHITSSSANGSPPISARRAPVARRSRSSARSLPRYSSGPGGVASSATVASPATTSTACSKAGFSASVQSVPGASVMSAPTRGV